MIERRGAIGVLVLLFWVAVAALAQAPELHSEHFVAAADYKRAFDRCGPFPTWSPRPLFCTLWGASDGTASDQV